MTLKRIVFMFILPLLIFSVILGTIQSITDHSINPRHDSVIDQLQEFNREADIGDSLDNEPERAEAQFRGLTTFNTLSAMNCMWPGAIYHSGRTDGPNHEENQEAYQHIVDEADDLDDTEDIEEGIDRFYHENGSWDEVMQFGSRTSSGSGVMFSYGSVGEEFEEFDRELMNVLVHDEDYSLTCLSASPITLAECTKGFTSCIGDAMKDVAVSAGETGLDIAAGATAGAAAGSVIPGAGTATGFAVGATMGYFASPTGFLQGESTPLDDFEGHSAQGKFGQVEFKIHEGFKIEDERNFAWVMDWARHENSPGSSIPGGWSSVEPSPDFTRGQRAQVFIPDGIARKGTSAEDFMHENERDRTVGSETPGDQAITAFKYVGESYSSSGGSEGRRRYINIWNDDWQSEGVNDVGWAETMNAFRVRMDPPAIAKEGNFQHDESGHSNSIDNIDLNSGDFQDVMESISDGDDWVEMKHQIEFMVRNIDYYAMCEGFEGWINSNAGDIDETGKAYAGEDITTERRDIVFPEVRLKENSEVSKEECVEEHLDDYREYEGPPWFDGVIYIPE